MVQLARTDLFLHVCHRVEGDTGVVSPANLKTRDVRRRCALLRIQSQNNVVEFVFRCEARDLAPAEQSLERRRNAACGNAEVFGSIPVERYDELGFCNAKIGVDVDQSWNRARARSERVHPANERLEIAVLDNELDWR